MCFASIVGALAVREAHTGKLRDMAATPGNHYSYRAYYYYCRAVQFFVSCPAILNSLQQNPFVEERDGTIYTTFSLLDRDIVSNC